MSKHEGLEAGRGLTERSFLTASLSANDASLLCSASTCVPTASDRSNVNRQTVKGQTSARVRSNVNRSKVKTVSGHKVKAPNTTFLGTRVPRVWFWACLTRWWGPRFACSGR